MDQVVNVHMKLHDQTSAGLEKIHHLAEGIQDTFSDLIPIAGGFGAALGLGKIIHTTETYLKRVKEINELTGATASETDFLLSTARKAGVSYDEMQNSMFMLSRRAAQLEGTLAAAQTRVPGMAQKFQRLGVDITKGPVASIEAMSKAVKAGKLTAGDLMAQFRIPRGAAVDMERFLQQLDPKKLRAARRGGAGLITSTDIESFNKMEEAQHRIADAWNRVQIIIGTKLIPVFAPFIEKVASQLENVWIPAAERFGQLLVKHMDLLIAGAKVFVGIMTTRKLLGVLGHVPGIGGVIGKVTAPLAGILTTGPVAAFAALKGTLIALAPVIGAVVAAIAAAYLIFRAFQNNVDGLRDRFMAFWDSIRARVSLIVDAFAPLVDAVEKFFAGAGGGGGILDFIGKILAMPIMKMISDIDLWLHIIQTAISFLGELGDQIALFWQDNLAKPFQDYVVKPVMSAMKWLAEGISKVVDFVMEKVNSVVKWVGGTPFKGVGAGFDLGYLQEPVNMWMKHWQKTQAATDALVAKRRGEEVAGVRREPTAARPPAPNYDFRGSRFDITQKFAEGFDPDRIAVSFANDLASLGELKSQSGFAPVFAAH